jgi:hypothetical protein
MMRNMNWIAGLVSLFAAGAMAGQTASAIGDFGGKYVVTDIVGYSDTSGGLPAAKKLLGETLVISPEAIDFSGDHCVPNTGFHVKRVVTEPLLKKYYGVPRADVGLPAKTTVLDSGNCVPVFRMDKYRVLLGSDGVVVRAIRDNDEAQQAREAPAKQ